MFAKIGHTTEKPSSPRTPTGRLRPLPYMRFAKCSTSAPSLGPTRYVCGNSISLQKASRNTQDSAPPVGQAGPSAAAQKRTQKRAQKRRVRTLGCRSRDGDSDRPAEFGNDLLECGETLVAELKRQRSDSTSSLDPALASAYRGLGSPVKLKRALVTAPPRANTEEAENCPPDEAHRLYKCEEKWHRRSAVMVYGDEMKRHLLQLSSSMYLHLRANIHPEINIWRMSMLSCIMELCFELGSSVQVFFTAAQVMDHVFASRQPLDLQLDANDPNLPRACHFIAAKFIDIQSPAASAYGVHRRIAYHEWSILHEATSCVSRPTLWDFVVASLETMCPERLSYIDAPTLAHTYSFAGLLCLAAVSQVRFAAREPVHVSASVISRVSLWMCAERIYPAEADQIGFEKVQWERKVWLVQTLQRYAVTVDSVPAIKPATLSYCSNSDYAVSGPPLLKLLSTFAQWQDLSSCLFGYSPSPAYNDRWS